MADDMLVRYEVEKLAHGAQGKERARLRAILGWTPEPCKVWENSQAGYMYCSTHAEMWHKRLPKPSAACFKHEEFEVANG